MCASDGIYSQRVNARLMARFIHGTYEVNEQYYAHQFRHQGLVKEHRRVEGSRGTREGREVTRLYRSAMREHFHGRGMRKAPNCVGEFKRMEEGNGLVHVWWWCDVGDGDIGGTMAWAD